jgi:hypothetical protein
MNKLLVLGVVGLCGCGASGGATSDELAALTGGHDATLAQQQSLAVADQLFNFDPTLDPTQSASANAAAIQTRAMTTMPCATVSLSGTTVTVTAAAPGCTGTNGVTFSGTIAATVTSASGTLTVTLVLTNVVFDGNATSGTITFVTTNGTTFQVTFATTRNSKTVSGTLTAVGATGQITTSGNVVNGSTSAVLTNVLWKKGDCYPSSGTIAVTVGKLTTTYAFSASTPSTGTVTTARGASMQLPTYGSCPSGADH